jgi:hypothetical protein
LVLAIFVFIQSATAAPLSAVEIAHRTNAVTRAYKLLAGVIPKARTDGRIYGWAKAFHISRQAYDQAVDRVLERAGKPYNRYQVTFAKSNHDLDACSPGVLAYVRNDDRIIQICNYFFKFAGPDQASALLHEHFHVQGILDECDAEAMAYLTFRGAGVETTGPVYLKRCAAFRRFIDTLK